MSWKEEPRRKVFPQSTKVKVCETIGEWVIRKVVRTSQGDGDTAVQEGRKKNYLD